MAETGDLINEFKQAKPPEKVVIVVGILAVAGVAFYLYKKGQAASVASSATGGAPTSQTAGYPMAGNTPVLPSGVTPQFDPNGNLIDFQNPPPPGTTPPPTTFAWPAALSGMKIWKGTTTGNYFFGPNGPQPGRANQTLLSSLFPQGTTFSGGTGGQLTYTLPGGTPTTAPLTLANPVPKTSMIASNTTVAKTAAGGTH